MSEMRKFSTGGISGERVRVYDVIFEAGGAGTCDLREGSPGGTILASLRLAGAGQVTWSSGDPKGVVFVGGLYAVPTAGTLTVSYAATPMRVVIPSGLYAHYDFSDVSTLYSDVALKGRVAATGAAIGSVADKSGNGHDLTRGGASGTEPTYTTAVINNLSIARFDGTADYLKTIATDLTVAQPFTIAAVLSRSSTATTDVYVAGSVTEFQGTATASQQVQMDAGTALSTGTLATTAGIAVGYANGASSKVYWNGGAGTGGAGGAGNLTTASLLYVGSNATPGNYHVGDIGEVLIFDKLLNVGDINQVGTYLSRKWGLAWTTAT